MRRHLARAIFNPAHLGDAVADIIAYDFTQSRK